MVCTLLAGVNVVAFAADDELSDSTPVFCAYNKNNGEHFFTANEAEYNNLVSIGWDGEGQKWSAPLHSDSPIYRLYNQNSGEHYFTLSEAEAAMLASVGWNDEGVGMYSDDNMGTPIYCMYNPNATGQFEAGAHHYTKDEAEAASLESIGWVWTNDGQAAFYGVVEEEPTILVNVTEAEQLSADTVEVTFDQDASLLVDKDDITVAKADGTLVLPIKDMTFASDGMSAVLKLSITLEDAVDYVVTLNESEAGFTASLGEVSYITVTSASAQKGVVTPIEFALYDEMGVDITSTIDVDSTCSVEVVGNDVVDDTSIPSSSTITMNTVGEEALVTVTYNSGDTDAEDVVGNGTITCIPAEAVVGMPIYYETDDASKVNSNSMMAKYYLGNMSSEPITVVKDGDPSDQVYFCAANAADFTVYSYDEWDISSSDEDVMTITSSEGDGKNVKFTVSGNKVGTANVVIKATVNDVDTYYTVPVRVVEKGILSTVSYSVDKTVLTNAIDEDYYATSTITAYDSNGIDITDEVQYDYQITSGKSVESEGGDADATASALVDPNKNYAFAKTMQAGFAKYENDEIAYYTATASANSGKRVIKATVSDGEKDVAKTINIQINKIADTAWNDAASTAAAVSYKVELASKTLNSSADDLFQTTARLGAYVGGKFVGYVRTDGDGVEYIGTPNNTVNAAATGSAINIAASSRIDDGSLSFGMKWGSKYNTTYAPAQGSMSIMAGSADYTNVLYANSLDSLYETPNQAANFAGEVTLVALDPALATQLKAKNPIELDYYVGSPKMLSDVARPGSYTATFVWTTAGEKKSQTDKVTVGDLLGTMGAAETVTVKETKLSDYSIEGIKEALYAIADMNVNEGGTSAITKLADADGEEITVLGDKSQYVRYAVVTDDINAAWVKPDVTKASVITVNFYVPISTTFRSK